MTCPNRHFPERRSGLLHNPWHGLLHHPGLLVRAKVFFWARGRRPYPGSGLIR